MALKANDEFIEKFRSDWRDMSSQKGIVAWVGRKVMRFLAAHAPNLQAVIDEEVDENGDDTE